MTKFGSVSQATSIAVLQKTFSAVATLRSPGSVVYGRVLVFPEKINCRFSELSQEMSTGSGPPSGTDSPRSFTSQNATAEDLLNSKTVGLVNLADYRKRRADIAEQREKDAHEQRYGRLNSGVSGTATPNTDESDG